ncbi:uncharacterized protein LOC127831685 [Dreissena polymorpha]|uniref:uncharacterized protein LOC127831685 n=1 Tax=Dreissena polymorpha TaxID=45954 RepID=UPI002264EE1A|nr:uncharacterized protein LOC127831685 [Dreissena polymorpha]
MYSKVVSSESLTTLSLYKNDNLIYFFLSSVIEENSVLACKQSDKEWACPAPQCRRILSRKQTLKSHLLSVHNISYEVPVKRYKLYDYDSSVPVPRRTHFRQKKLNVKKESHEQECQEHCEIEASTLESSATAASNEMGPSEETSSDMDLSSDASSDQSDISSSESSESSDSETESAKSEANEQASQATKSAPLYVVQSSSGEMYSSDLSKYDHTLAVAAFISRHNLSDTATEHLIKLINLHIPNNSLLEKNSSKLKEKLGFDADYMKYYFFCNVCKSVFEDNDDQCSTPNCNGIKLSKRTQTYFSSGNVEIQLKEILNRKGILDSIQEVYDREMPLTINDVTDGSEYKKLCEDGGFLSNRNNISLTMFTDGIPLFKSSGVSLWPVYLLINEIPRHERFRKKNMVLWGMWQGLGKPNMTLFLKPLVSELNHLYSNGFQMNVGTEEINCKAQLIVGTMDLQARAAVLHMTQHNGEYACVYCMHPGKVVKSGKGHCRSFPYTKEPLLYRTAERIQADGKKAQKDRKKVNGFTGESVLNYLPNFSLDNNIVIDYMHGSLLGISKKFLSLWFDTKNVDKPYYIGGKIKEVDKMMKMVTPPYVIKRLPRKLSNTLQHWKASELRSWLLFYSLPVLNGILPETYLKHFSLIVEAIYILLGEGITNEDIERADHLLNVFVKTVDALYDSSVLGLNIHNLLHLCDCVRKWGPLWAWSCFSFESFNGEIKKTIHGTGSVCKQVFWALQSQKRVENISTLPVSDKVKTFVEDLHHGKSVTDNALSAVQCSVNKASALPDNFQFPDKVKLKLHNIVKSDSPSMFLRTNKIFRGGLSVYSKLCSKVRKRNSYTWAVTSTADDLEDGSILEIEYFLVHKRTMQVFAVGKKLKTVGGVLPGNAPHIQRVQYSSNEVTLMPVSTLQDVIISFELNGLKYASRFPNSVESD